MAFFADIEEMFRHRAEKARKKANREWARACNGGDQSNYGKARKDYHAADEEDRKADRFRGKKWI